jgi:hypothetical protein
VKPGDLIKLPQGSRTHWGLPTGVALLIEKLPRTDILEYDWQVLVDGRYINLGRQIEQSAEVISEGRSPTGHPSGGD